MAKATVSLYVRISPEVSDDLDKYLAESGDKKNAVVEAALKEYLIWKRIQLQGGQ